MFFALRAEARAGEVEQGESRTDRIGGDGLVAEIDAKPAGARPADHAREQEGGRFERQVGKPSRVSGVVKQASAGRAFDVWLVALGVSGKCRRAAEYDLRDFPPAPTSRSRKANTAFIPARAGAAARSGRTRASDRRRRASRRKPGRAAFRSKGRVETPHRRARCRCGPCRRRDR